jgi:hypothetical protein
MADVDDALNCGTIKADSMRPQKCFVKSWLNALANNSDQGAIFYIFGIENSRAFKAIAVFCFHRNHYVMIDRIGQVSTTGGHRRVSNSRRLRERFNRPHLVIARVGVIRFPSRHRVAAKNAHPLSRVSVYRSTYLIARAGVIQLPSERTPLSALAPRWQAPASATPRPWPRMP